MHLVQSRPPPLLFFKMRKVVNYDFGASTLQGLYWPCMLIHSGTIDDGVQALYALPTCKMPQDQKKLKIFIVLAAGQSKMFYRTIA